MSLPDNKAELIDYHILILLILKSRNIEKFLAKSITEYLVPTLSKDKIKKFLDNSYSTEIYSLYNFLSKNNLKYRIFPHLNCLLYNMSSFSTVFISYHKYNDNGKIYYNIEYRINLFYIYYIDYFQFNIRNENLYLYIEDWTFIEFDRLNTMIYNDNCGILMDNYVFSSHIKKYIYYQIYKKCIRPFIRNILLK
jgi:hypothetical protein